MVLGALAYAICTLFVLHCLLWFFAFAASIWLGGDVPEFRGEGLRWASLMIWLVAVPVGTVINIEDRMDRK
jgi:membrane protein DedA with SNARE-associated domain